MTTIEHFHRQLLVNLQQRIVQQPPFNADGASEQDGDFVALLNRLCDDPHASSEGQHLGQYMINTIIARYPHITPMVPRDLFWFFGGDCLHFLGDEEIAIFQQLDEDYHLLLSEHPESVDYTKLRASHFATQPQQIN